MVTVVGTIKAKSDAVGRVRSKLLSLVEPSRKEFGCIHYSLYQDNETPNLLVVYEKWESKRALDDHMNTPNFRESFSEIEGLYEVDVHLLTELC